MKILCKDIIYKFFASNINLKITQSITDTDILDFGLETHCSQEY